MTKKQKTILLICAVIFIGSYIARSIILRAMGIAYARQYTKQLKEKPKPETKAADAKTEAAVANLAGVWQGAGPLKDRGTCNLRVELKQNEPGHYTGDSRFSCIKFGVPQAPNPMANPVTIDAQIMTGTVEKGGIHFRTDKAIGADVNGCTVTNLTITPFGANAIAAEWQEGTCAGGHYLMTREGR
jgi:hypothetical protein